MDIIQQVTESIQEEMDQGQRALPAHVKFVERVSEGILKVTIEWSESIGHVRSQLEGGTLFTSEDADESEGRAWIILSLGEAFEGNVLYLYGYEFLSSQEQVFITPFNFIDPLIRILSCDILNDKIGRTLSLMESGGEKLNSRQEDKVFKQDIKRAWNSHVGCVWGPPGTGKTYTLGRQAALTASTTQKRILAVSTTNDATDLIALELSKALQENKGNKGQKRRDVVVKRVGSGLNPGKFSDDHKDLIPEVNEVLKGEIEALIKKIPRLRDSARAVAKKRLFELKMEFKDEDLRYIFDSDCQVVVTTAYNALKRLADALEEKDPEDLSKLFDIVCIDEAGLVSKPVAAALSAFAAEKVVLFGDPRQLAPIALSSQYLKESSIGALCDGNIESTDLLREQRRMDPEIREVVSAFMYDGQLLDTDLNKRNIPLLSEKIRPGHISVIFLDGVTLKGNVPIPFVSLGAEQGPHRKSYIRRGSAAFFESLFQRLGESIQNKPGMYIAPFRAQIEMISRDKKDYIGKSDSWTFNTVHAQQGGEAPFVIFDTVDMTKVRHWCRVNPESKISEWQRLINVAISRAQKAVFIVTTLAEWQSTLRHVQGLKAALKFKEDCLLTWSHERGALIPMSEVDLKEVRVERPHQRIPGSLGELIEMSKTTPVLTKEQRELVVNTSLDGPLLVMGAPGSGKTLVLVEWALRTKAAHPSKRVGIVHFSKSLGRLIESHLDRVAENLGLSKVHCKSLRDNIFIFRDIIAPEYSYDDWYADWNGEKTFQEAKVSKIFDVLFVDEAQDFGPNGLKFWMNSAKNKMVRMMCDPMQNVGNTIIDWDEFADEQGMERLYLAESHRSTNKIMDMAINLFIRMGESPVELMERGLAVPLDVEFVVGEEEYIEEDEEDEEDGGDEGDDVEEEIGGAEDTESDGEDDDIVTERLFVSDISMNEGPDIEVSLDHEERNDEINWVAERINQLIYDESVLASEIGIIVNTFWAQIPAQNYVLQRLKDKLKGKVLFGRNKTESQDDIEVFRLEEAKGYEFEVVILLGADALMPHSKSEIKSRAHHLFTAITRARHKLIITGSRQYNSQKCQYSGRNVLDEIDLINNFLCRPDYGLLRSRTIDEIDSKAFLNNIKERVERDVRAWCLNAMNKDELMDLLSKNKFHFTRSNTKNSLIEKILDLDIGEDEFIDKFTKREQRMLSILVENKKIKDEYGLENQYEMSEDGFKSLYQDLLSRTLRETIISPD